jgi:plastocyanin
MSLQQAFRSAISCRATLAASALSLVLGGVAAIAAGPHVVSQAGRQFNPAQINIARGEVVQLLNDDGDLLHHAYIDSDRMNFDSGDQKPGSRVDIVFKVAGDFVVLCAIHPKMKLRVHVK